MNNDTAMHANDLTQLSSREQLSALMDDALPADETRFLLRRLQHDAPLADCWERWRLAGEVMRGLAPAQRLPADFAVRVGAALHGTAPQAALPRRAAQPAWMRWGGGAAMAASLAVAALVLQRPAVDAATVAPAVLATTTADGPAPMQSVLGGSAQDAQVLAAASAVAGASRASRASRPAPADASAARSRAHLARSSQGSPATQIATAASADSLPLMQQPDIVTRPWPRAVLPQYGSEGLTVGFGNQAQVGYTPFQAHAPAGIAPVDADVRGAALASPAGDAPTPQP